jgi:hypothetical protein
MWLLLVLAVVLIAAGAGAAVLLLEGRREPTPPKRTATAPPVATIAPVQRAADVARSAPENVCDHACCGDSGECNLPDGRVGCPSGRDCTAAGCGELLEPGRRFRVRFVSAAPTPL